MEIKDRYEIFPVLDKTFKPKIFLLKPLGGGGCLQSQNVSWAMLSCTNSENRESKHVFTQKPFYFQPFFTPKVVLMGKQCNALFKNYLANTRSSKSAQNII